MTVADHLLDKIDWSAISHAYGGASDTPKHLRNLQSSRKSKLAIDELFSSINHQGDHSEAGFHSAPYLLEIIRDPKLPNLARVLDLILGVAVGNPDDLLLIGEKIGDSLQRCREHAKQNPYPGWKLPDKCHKVMRPAIPQFLKLLRHTNRDVSWQSAYNLAWFPHAASVSIPAIRKQFETTKRSPEQFANYLLSLGLLEWHSNKRRGLSKSVKKHIWDSNKLTRYASAIYCSWFEIDKDIRQVLKEISVDDDFDGSRDNPHQIVFSNGCLTQYAEMLLAR